jgi:uncharacterized protein (DUF4415 family)
MSRKTKQPVLDKENPEWTHEDFSRGIKFPGGVRLKDVKPADLVRMIGKRGPQRAPTKVSVSIRLSPEVVKHFKDQGPGWQSRIDAALRKMVKKAG